MKNLGYLAWYLLMIYWHPQIYSTGCLDMNRAVFLVLCLFDPFSLPLFSHLCCEGFIISEWSSSRYILWDGNENETYDFLVIAFNA